MRILFCGQTFPEVRKQARVSLPDHGLILCSQEEVAQHVADVDVVVPLITPIEADLIERGTFSLIQQFGVGLDTVDLEAATRASVWVARIPSAQSGNADSVAGHTLLLLTLSRELTKARRALPPSSWRTTGHSTSEQDGLHHRTGRRRKGDGRPPSGMRNASSGGSWTPGAPRAS